MVQRLVFVRHAESTFSARGLVNGDPGVDCPLTDEGRRQADELRPVFAAEPVDVCVTTAFARTHETAEIALSGLGVPRVVEPALNDPPLGIFEAKPLTEFLHWLDSHDWFTRPDGDGESQIEAISRFVDGFEHVLARPERSVLVVAHQFPISVGYAFANERSPVVRRRYDRTFDHAVPIRIDPEALRRGLSRARQELAALRTA